MYDPENDGPPPPPDFEEQTSAEAETEQGEQEEQDDWTGATIDDAEADAPPVDDLQEGTVDHHAAIEIDMPREDIIPKILPAWQVHLFSGASGAGKTTLVAQLLAAIYTGSEFFGWQTRPVNFIGVLAADREWGDHRQWYDAVGLDTLPNLSLVDDSSRGLSWVRKYRGRRHMLFRDMVKGLAQRYVGDDRLPADSLLVLDPVSLFLGGELNHYDRVFQHMLDLNQFALHERCTVLAIAHAGKQKADKKERYTRPQDRVSGSTAQTACAGTTLHLAPPSETDEEWSELTAVPHHAPASLLRLERDHQGLFIPIPDERPSRLQARALETKASLLDHLPEGGDGLPTSQIHEWAHVSLGLRRSAVFKHLAQLREDGLAEPVPGKRGRWRRRSVGTPS